MAQTGSLKPAQLTDETHTLYIVSCVFTSDIFIKVSLTMNSIYLSSISMDTLYFSASSAFPYNTSGSFQLTKVGEQSDTRTFVGGCGITKIKK